jgi:hypothetical protein
MTDKEAMKLALFALDIVKIHYTQSRHINEAIIALKERLADPMREVQRLGQEIEQEPVAKYCCRLCFNKSGSLLLDRMILCSECGNKRCPKATNHELQCTNSNAPNQAGSIYTQPPQRTEQEPCVHAKNPKGCYRVRCQVGDKCVDDEMSFRTTPPQPEQEPVAWLLTDKNINSLQVDSIQRLINRLNHAHHTDLCVRINGQDEWFQADWLKHMVRATPPQRTEQNPMPDEMLQAITDPENQPSQYGTVTLDYHFEKIKKWEDLFERMSNKVLAQPEQEPVGMVKDLFTSTAWERLDLRGSTKVYLDIPPAQPAQRTEQEPLIGCVNHDCAKCKPLTEEQIVAKALHLSGLGTSPDVLQFARAIEAAHGIKENT